MNKITLKTEFAEQLRKSLDCNDPVNADKFFKERIKLLANDKENKLESVLIFSVIPKSLEKWLKRYAKEKDFTVNLTGKNHNYEFSTQKSREFEEKQRKDQSDFYINWINSPG
jgi:hypothetical protein